MNDWKDYLPEMTFNVQLGPPSNRLVATLHCSVRQRIAHFSFEFLPNMEELYKSAQGEALNPYPPFSYSGCFCKQPPDVN